MNKIVGVGVGIALCVAGTSAFAGGKPDEKAAAEMKAVCEKMMNAFPVGDAAAFKSVLADNMWSAWDLDMVGQPVTMPTSADVMKLFDEMIGTVKAMGAKMTVTIARTDCHAVGDLGACMVEGNMTLTMANMPPMPLDWRNTEVMQKGKGGWKIVHHHGSIAKAPVMPDKFASAMAKTAPTQPAPGMPGMTMMPLWMNPITQQMVGIIKVKDGMKQARHMHAASYAFYVVEGGIVTTDGNGKDTEFGPGMVVYRPAKMFHTTAIKPNSTVFMVTNGPLDAVDANGKPVPMTPIGK